MDKTQKYAKWKESDTKGNMLYGSTYMKFLKGRIMLPVTISVKDFILLPETTTRTTKTKKIKMKKNDD